MSAILRAKLDAQQSAPVTLLGIAPAPAPHTPTDYAAAPAQVAPVLKTPAASPMPGYTTVALPPPVYAPAPPPVPAPLPKPPTTIPATALAPSPAAPTPVAYTMPATPSGILPVTDRDTTGKALVTRSDGTVQYQDVTAGGNPVGINWQFGVAVILAVLIVAALVRK